MAFASPVAVWLGCPCQLGRGLAKQAPLHGSRQQMGRAVASTPSSHGPVAVSAEDDKVTHRGHRTGRGSRSSCVQFQVHLPIR